MTEIQVEPLLEKIYSSLLEHIDSKAIDQPLVIGIHTGGAWVAERLYIQLKQAGITTDPLGTLDISFYRDDFSRAGLNPKVKTTRLPVATEDRHIILVDDVIMSGRTCRAALNALFEYGRPASVTLVALLDLTARELPIQADIIGKQLELAPNKRIKLCGPENLRLEVRTLTR